LVIFDILLGYFRKASCDKHNQFILPKIDQDYFRMTNDLIIHSNHI